MSLKNRGTCRSIELVCCQYSMALAAGALSVSTRGSLILFTIYSVCTTASWRLPTGDSSQSVPIQWMSEAARGSEIASIKVQKNEVDGLDHVAHMQYYRLASMVYEVIIYVVILL